MIRSSSLTVQMVIVLICAVASSWFFQTLCVSDWVQAASPPSSLDGEAWLSDAGLRRESRSSKGGTPVQWRVLTPPSGKRVEIGKFVPWCAAIGKPKPRIGRVEESDRGRRVLLTAYLIHRARGQCGRVETLVSYTVVLRKPLDGRELYDGSVHPAAKRWPRK